MSTDLTAKQREILAFIEKKVAERNIPPAVREICEAVGLKSTSTVHGHLERLEKKGFIKRDRTKNRSIEILKPSGLYCAEPDNVIPFPTPEVANIPVIGKVTAGQPILAHEEYDEYFPIPIDFVGAGDYFILRVSGDSMINVGIYDRDYVLVKQQKTADNGDMVVALIDDSATVKTYYKEKNRFRLQPENDSMSPIYADFIEILGLVKGVFRKL